MTVKYTSSSLFLLLSVLFFSIASFTALGQTIRYVSPTGTNTNPATATSWATSTTDLQGAINASASGSQVWVAAGTYKATRGTNRGITFAMKAGVAIYGGFAGNESLLADRPVIDLTVPPSTTLSGDIGTIGNTGDNTYSIFFNPAGLTTSAVLDGFVITGGNGYLYGGGMYNDGTSPLVRNCWFIANSAPSAAGAMYNKSSSPTIINCRFQGNASDYGAGMYNLTASNPTLTNCTFQSNTAGVNGGAIGNGSSSPQLTNCSFLNNRASGNTGGAIDNSTSSPQLTSCLFQGNSAAGDGGAIANSNSNPQLTDCVFQSNATSSNGGAMANKSSSTVQLTRCSFQSNSAASDGGAVSTNSGSIQLTNCLFQSNTASFTGGAVSNSSIGSSQFVNCSFLSNAAPSFYGGAIYNNSSSPILTNCSFQNNSASSFYEGGAIYNGGTSNLQLANCVFFGNGGSKTLRNDGSSITAQYSLFDASVTGYSGTNNLTTAVSPFATTSSSELKPNSSAINTGDPATTAATVGSTDLAGNARFYASGRIDMGAYEYQGVPLPVTLLYFNGRMTEAGALLGWATAREVNNAGFRIERSHDAFGFEVIANVQGGTPSSQATTGNSVTPLTYTYTDTHPLPGVNYYRLVQTDLDGTRTVSKIIALSKENQQTVVYPNPVGTLGEATLEPSLAYTSYELVDMLGRVCQQASTPGTLSRLSVGTLPAGIYVLRVQLEGGGQQNFRLVR